LEAEHAAPPPDVPFASLAVDVRAAAHALFLELPPRERAVVLSDVMDFSLQETASMLKTTVGAVKAALHRGLAPLLLQPDVLATVAAEVGVPALRRAYRSP